MIFTSFDIEPDEAVVDVLGLDVVIKGLDLASGIPALGAREDIEVDVLEASFPGLLDAGGALGVNMAEALVAADDGELVAIVLEARPGREGIVVRNIHTKSGAGGDSREGEDTQKRKDSLHLYYLLLLLFLI